MERADLSKWCVPLVDARTGESRLAFCGELAEWLQGSREEIPSMPEAGASLTGTLAEAGVVHVEEVPREQPAAETAPRASAPTE